MHVEFVGIPSGDGETFVTLVGREPREDDEAVFHKPARLYKLYPDNLPMHGGCANSPLRVAVSVEPAFRHHYAALKTDTGGTGNDGP